MRPLPAVLATILTILSAACSKAPAPAAPEQVYTVRGRVVALPDPAKPGGGLQIQHEPIPEYVNPKGERKGMGSMTMSFAPAEGLDLSGLATGDAVEFTWEVRWHEPRFWRVAAIRKLPAGTTLNFGSN
jgi:Cu/Ag efflux protein CusF